MASQFLSLSTSVYGLKTAVVELADLHCQGCADDIRKVIWERDGIESVTADVKTNLVTVVYSFPFSEELLLRILSKAKFELAQKTAPTLVLETPVPAAISA